jgi:uncharacterized membrane protein YjjB (DUF3815 family)
MAAATAAVMAVFLLVSPYVDQPGLAPGIAAVAAGVIGHLTYRWLKVPEGATTTAAIIGLIPGLAVYRALYVLVDSSTGVLEALPAAVDALATGIGLAAGTVIGVFLARRIFGLDRPAMIAARRARGVR